MLCVSGLFIWVLVVATFGVLWVLNVDFADFGVFCLIFDVFLLLWELLCLLVVLNGVVCLFHLLCCEWFSLLLG